MQVILEAYLQVLEVRLVSSRRLLSFAERCSYFLLLTDQSAGQRDLIAMYAGALGDNAVERYALFLASLELSTDVHERKMALVRARDHGLDVERVAVVTAERTIERAFNVRFPFPVPFTCWLVGAYGVCGFFW